LATGAVAQPVIGLHESVVHGLLSLHVTALPPPQAPAVQTSPDVHALLSLHVDPSAFAGLLHIPVIELHVPTSWH